MLRFVFTTLWLEFGLVKETGLFEHSEQPSNFAIEHLFSQRTIIERMLDVLLRHPTGAARHLEIKSTVGHFPIIGAEPIRHDYAVESPFSFKDIVECMLIFASICSVYTVICRHNRPWL